MAASHVHDRPAGGYAEPRRSVVPAGAVHGLILTVTILLVLGPILPLAYSSVRSIPFYLPGGEYTLDPYRQLLVDPLVWRAIRNTLVFAAITTALAVGLGMTFAVLCTRTDLPGANVFRALLLAPVVLPPLGLMLGWVAIYGQGGYLTATLDKLGLPVWDLSSVPGMALIAASIAMPIAFLTCQAALAGSDPSLESAARSAGASTLTVITRITLPLLRPAALNSAVLILVLSLETLGLPLVIGSRNHIDFFASYLYRAWSDSDVPDPTFVSAGAMLLLVVVTVLLFLRQRLMGAEQRFIAVTGKAAAGDRLALGRWGRPIAVLITIYLLLTAAIPVLGLGLMSIVGALTPLIPPWELLTLRNWASISSGGTFTQSVLNSVLIAVIGGGLTTLGVAIAALVAHRTPFRPRQVQAALLLYPKAVPGLIVGLGFFWVFLLVNPPGLFLRNSIWGVMLALCVRNVTLAYVVILPSLIQIGGEIDAAAKSAGATWGTTVTRIMLPLLRPAILTAFVLMFVVLLNDYDPALFLVTPNSPIMGVTILQSWRTGASGPVAALAIVQILITATVLGSLALVSRRWRRA